MQPDTLRRIVTGYLDCAAWADKPEGSRAQFSHAEQATAARVCSAFIQCAGPLAGQALDAYRPESFGHDLWLTRTGSGTGYHDRTELDIPATDAPALQDRDGAPMPPDGSTLADALSALAYGTRARISPFAYPSLTAWRGWLTVDGSAEHWARGHASPWGFWQRFTLTE